MEDLRESSKYMLSVLFKEYCNNYEEIAYKFEKEMYCILSEREYITRINKLYDILLTQDGYFPDDLLILKYISNSITVEEILNYTNKEDDPRKVIKKLFTTLLYNSDPYFTNNKELTLKIAKKIEKSCFNNVINTCKKSDNPPCRQWSHNLFQDIYSNKCGSIYNLLNPKSRTCKLYGSTLLTSIINNTIDLDTIADKSEKDLCPQSVQKERDEIALRSEQHVVEKESNLFKCPNCKERKVTYREVQLRALDEAPDYLCVCLNCRHRFKGK